MRVEQTHQDWIHFFWAGEVPLLKNLFDWQKHLLLSQSNFKVKLWVDKKLFSHLKNNPVLFKTKSQSASRDITLFSSIKTQQNPNQFEATLITNGCAIVICDFDAIILDQIKTELPNIYKCYDMLHTASLYAFSSETARLLILQKEPGFYCDFDTTPNTTLAHAFPKSLTALKELATFNQSLLLPYLSISIISHKSEEFDFQKHDSAIVFRNEGDIWFVYYWNFLEATVHKQVIDNPIQTEFLTKHQDTNFYLPDVVDKKTPTQWEFSEEEDKTMIQIILAIIPIATPFFLRKIVDNVYENSVILCVDRITPLVTLLQLDKAVEYTSKGRSVRKLCYGISSKKLEEAIENYKVQKKTLNERVAEETHKDPDAVLIAVKEYIKEVLKGKKPITDRCVYFSVCDSRLLNYLSKVYHATLDAAEKSDAFDPTPSNKQIAAIIQTQFCNAIQDKAEIYSWKSPYFMKLLKQKEVADFIGEKRKEKMSALAAKPLSI